jgi:glucose-6-phosphate isomerase
MWRFRTLRGTVTPTQDRPDRGRRARGAFSLGDRARSFGHVHRVPFASSYPISFENCALQMTTPPRSPKTLAIGSAPSLIRFADIGLTLDLIDAPTALEQDFAAAFSEMDALEAGEAVNTSEDRQVGHYWLRSPELAPSAELQREIRSMWDEVEKFEAVKPRQVLLLGIGGSALGIQMVDECLRTSETPELICLDNCDPSGIADQLQKVDPRQCLVLVASKSGKTNETLLALAATRSHWDAAGVDFEPCAIAITGADSHLAHLATNWRACVPVWDFVGGRTSLTSAVGLVPMALLGYDWRALLQGAMECDRQTRSHDPNTNPAARLAGLWWQEKRESDLHNLVFQPYRDRLCLLPAYLQQLIMESLGKRENRQGEIVEEGLVVFGNKGSTDQHSFMQQLVQGHRGNLVHFVETSTHESLLPAHEKGLACDHLVASLYGNRQALAACGRPSVTLTVRDTSPYSLGVLVALFERTVGIYAGLAQINAYDQPGVEAGKIAGRANLELIASIARALSSQPQRAHELAAILDAPSELVWRFATHLAATGRALVENGSSPQEDRFTRVSP